MPKNALSVSFDLFYPIDQFILRLNMNYPVWPFSENIIRTDPLVS